VLLAAPLAHALGTDRTQAMVIEADYSKMQQGTDDKPGIAYLNGNVHVVQGSMKAHSSEATIYQHPTKAKDAQGNDVSGGIQRVILIGKKKQAHIEQMQDNDGGLMAADADKIDYNNDTNIADLTGNVTVLQQNRGVFHGAHMTYNTRTGEMESGDLTPEHRVHIVMFPKATPNAPAPATAANVKPAPTFEPATPANENSAPAAEPPTPANESPAPATEPATPANESPAPAAEPPMPVSETPAPAAEPPMPVSETPAPADKKPTPTNNKKPTPANKRPTPVNEPPMPVNEAPRVNEAPPVNETPTRVNEAPPVNETPARVNETPTPINDTLPPVDILPPNDETPTPTNQAPTPTNAKPAPAAKPVKKKKPKPAAKDANAPAASPGAGTP
jgi:lipopolysaccharide export system protein LptA